MTLRENEIAARRRVARKRKPISEAEAERRRRQRERDLAAPGIGHNRGPVLVPPDAPRDDFRVMRFKAWCKSKGFSEATARRLLKAGKGPRIVQLSPRTIGVTVRDDRLWTEARIRGGA